MTNTSPDWAALLDEIERLAYVAAGIEVTGRTVVWRDGRAVIERDPPTSDLPDVDSAAWWDAPARIRIAALVLLAREQLTVQRQLAEQQRAVSVAVSTGMDWAAAAHHLVYAPHRVLAARRAEPGPLARTVDPAGMARWVETGSSSGEESAA